MSNDDFGENIKEGVVDKLQQIVEASRLKLQKIQCPEHGQALRSLEFNRTSGSFRIDTCCPVGERLVQDGISKL